MSEMQSAGFKEFLISLVWAAALFVMGGSVSYAIPLFKVIGSISTLLLLCAFAFFVLTRYSAVFTYSLNGYILRVNRTIGHRNKEIEIKLSQIKAVSAKDPRIKPTYRMRKYILRNRLDCYITFSDGGTEKCLLFDPSPELLGKIKKQMKKADKNEPQ